MVDRSFCKSYFRPDQKENKILVAEGGNSAPCEMQQGHYT